MKTTLAATLMALMMSVTNAQATETFNNSGIGEWIAPNALFGLVFTLIFFWVCMCVLQALHAVQTPRIMLEKSIDWGKIEKVEE